MPIYKRGKTWYADLYVNGKRSRKRLSTNKATAQKMYEEILKRKDFSPFGTLGYNYDLEKIQKQFLLEMEPRVSAKTLHDYNVFLNGVTNRLKGTPFDSVRNDFNAYILQRQKQGISARSLNLTIELSRRMFRHAIETKLIPTDPLSGIQKLKGAKKIKRALTPDEIKPLLDNSGQYKIIWLTFLHTGLRRSELVELKWKDVDLDKGIISIVKNQPGKGVGTIPMSEKIKKELKLLKQGEPDDYVFTTKNGTPYRNNLMRAFRECLKRAGIDQEGISIHSLRYTFATKLASQNKHPKLIQALMRHKHISTSMDIYTDVYKKDLHGAVDDLDFDQD
ncbi:MAG: hypothetical protein D8M57_13000 [Candidatus Scalindua sp. AMX11]|nr:MAG: hypothetical protein DWQ00_12090 [Candidatus Scalindua sp.]NOG83812.1 tyrosine-type recombinase/integrase [Planctomycetota bacterium]RZV82966.1 MAG: hypothetical protein EX341_09245 [Candidatus Scalindua sp. SCAELEC01]TDE64412.1 MAG: hypothetical protein D8M57_13000 [Candidatus Scalindua sp. AMX11]GJQ59738.1 MAG: site-specific integrase [Candidatus Scalindua sp.]